MSRNRIKAVSYEDDDYYDEEDEQYEEEISAEDREKMRVGVIEVRQLLELQVPPVPATEQEIAEALWNYYYDVDTSVEYLKSKSLVTPRPRGGTLLIDDICKEKYFPPTSKKKKKGKRRHFYFYCLEGGGWDIKNGLSALRKGPTLPGQMVRLIGSLSPLSLGRLNTTSN
jgi:hypothetical protein